MKAPTRLFFVSLLLTAILPSLISGLIFYFLKSQQEHFFLHPYSVHLFLLLSIITMGLALTPTTFIALISGYFFGWGNFAEVVLAYLAASLLGLAAGRFLINRGIKISEDKSSILEKLLQRLNNDQLIFIILSRLSPVLPFAMTNLALATLKIKPLKYLGGTLVGMLPRTIVFFYTGTKARNIWEFVKHPDLKNGLQYIPVALLLVSTVGLTMLLKKEITSIRHNEAIK